MKFFRQTNWLFKKTIFISPGIRYLLTILFWLMVTGIWYAIVYYPLRVMYDSSKSGYAALQNEIKELQPLQKQLEERTRLFTTKKEFITNFCAQQESCQEHVETFLALLENHNLTLISYSTTPTHLKLKGSFESLLAFLGELATSVTRALKITSMDILRIDEGLLNISFSIDFIQFHEKDNE